MKTIFSPYDWHFEFPKCTIGPNLGGLLRYQEKSVSIFGKIDVIRKINQLEDKIKLLENQVKLKEKLPNTIIRNLPDDEAQCEIESFLKVKKKSGTKIVNILDLMQGLNLQPHQIEMVMTKLKSKGVKPTYA